MLFSEDQPDVLIGTTGIKRTGLNLARATVVVLLEPIYVSKSSKKYNAHQIATFYMHALLIPKETLKISRNPPG